MMHEHRLSGNPPFLISDESRKMNETNVNVTDISDRLVQEALMNACDRGVQGGDSMEWYSELVNEIAREQGIPVVDSFNMTRNDVFAIDGMNETTGMPNSCAATVDGVHYHDPTMWKQLHEWFAMFSTRSSASNITSGR